MKSHDSWWMNCRRRRHHRTGIYGTRYPGTAGGVHKISTGQGILAQGLRAPPYEKVDRPFSNLTAILCFLFLQLVFLLSHFCVYHFSNLDQRNNKHNKNVSRWMMNSKKKWSALLLLEELDEAQDSESTGRTWESWTPLEKVETLQPLRNDDAVPVHIWPFQCCVWYYAEHPRNLFMCDYRRMQLWSFLLWRKVTYGPFCGGLQNCEVEEIMEAVSFNASEKPVEWQLSAACYVWDPKGRDNC